MQIEEICKEIVRICENEEYSYKEYKYKIGRLNFEIRKCTEAIKEIEVKTLIESHEKLSKIKNRKASYAEDGIMREILVNLPMSLRYEDENIPEDEIEILQEKYDKPVRSTIKLSSILMKYGKEILSQNEEKSKRYKKKIKEAIRLLIELNMFYDIQGLKELFLQRITDKDKDVQFFALYGLENYYASINSGKLSEEEIKKIENIIKQTEYRETASTCCQILINSDIIDEFGAMMKMDDWKDRNWRK